MDEHSKAKLDEILAQDPSGCTPDDIAFLKARRSYLSPAQVEKYALSEKEDSASDEPKPKKK